MYAIYASDTRSHSKYVIKTLSIAHNVFFLLSTHLHSRDTDTVTPKSATGALKRSTAMYVCTKRGHIYWGTYNTVHNEYTRYKTGGGRAENVTAPERGPLPDKITI